ncbi:DMT family transporter [Nioella sp.]|uniref:DMT family transporter n=1 Tax=Nioella sp. TaxID=1912091 RepID=UPI003A88FF28
MAPPPSPRVNKVLPGVLLSLLAILLFDLMGLVIKHLSTTYGAAELSAWRNLFGLIPASIALWSTRSWHAGGRKLRLRQWQIPVIRGFAVTVAQFCFYLALGRLAFATAATISYSNALFILVYSVPLLGERVGLFRWSAALVGFAGVVMVMGPGRDSFTWEALLPLIAAALYAFAGVSSRMMDEDVPSPLINLWSSSVSAIGAFTLAMALGGFTAPASLTDMGWILLMGLCGGSAVLSMVVAYRMTEPGNLAPFAYLGIPTAFVLGWLFFGESPFSDLFPGAILIIAGGMMILWRERRIKRQA